VDLRLGRICAVVAGVWWLACGGAEAATTVIAKAGAWQAFHGTSTDGTEVCGISTTWPDNRYFGLKFYKGDKTFTIQLGSPKWQINDGTKQRVFMQIDQNARWVATASGMHFSKEEAGLEFEINSGEVSTFVSEFRGGSQLLLQFPDFNVEDWTAALDGTRTLIGSFLNCIEAL